ncbi:MAG: purine-binding chemotaxis protein CheW [Candidatus Delongbacteria bacterium]|nr:purine-binding chemotaxis protein CheW [Candidatus Delongbacteria bacterium]MBN2834630.1 purine-binding chemotaxis protein CheW [Candidatus Delongbacteria bacterium]
MSDLFRSEFDSFDDYDDEEDEIIQNRYLTFKVGEEEYGIDIHYVLEIVGLIKITPLPETENYIKGVVNLRGQVIPVIDMRLRFSLPQKDYDMTTCIIVVNLNEKYEGLIVDNVSEVMEIPEENITRPEKIKRKTDGKYVSGLGKVGQDVKILLDLEKLLTDDIDVSLVID